ncbi:hypothetical protein [Streptomonospora litoralis]|uniref:Uncharacterized protein n=1 Tax=Streptomonospora litoralis TaxID=2498135 RepID=A0A4P6Q2S1_9ACTN|nr:hypothetical protein [Streptomonospora litoralis]QBI53084.1 hypothetical protein EKD16_06430 [Streptomonospora litoralis]
MTRPWEADPEAPFARRLGKTAKELGETKGRNGCPEIWQLGNGDVAVIGRDLTAAYAQRLPEGVTIAPDERLVVISGRMLGSAKPDIADA